MKMRVVAQQTGRASIWVLLLVVVILVGLAGYWYYQPQAAPGWVRGQLFKAAHTTVPLYRWQDERGQWHITDNPPPGRHYETVTYRRDANVMPAGETGKR